MVRAPSSVTVRFAVRSRRLKSAVMPLPEATLLLNQFAVVGHEPPSGLVHVGTGAMSSSAMSEFLLPWLLVATQR